MFPSLFFTVDKQHAHDLSAVLRGNGVKVYPLTENTPLTERRRFIRMFKDGSIEGLASCGIMDEGFDAPNAIGGFHCAPTKSELRYRQRAGRIFRPMPAPTGERPYQKAALHAIWNGIRRGVFNQLMVLPTGTGKTYVSAQVPKVIDYWKKEARRGRLIFLVHRDELVTQAADTFQQHTTLKVGIEKADVYAGDADVIVGSVQTLGPAKGDDADGWTYNPRLEAINPYRVDCVITDESHHAVKGKYYHNILRRLHALKGMENRDPGILSLYITATPNRSDNIGMEKLCDEITYEYRIIDAVKQGYLAPLRAYRCETTADISHVGSSMGDLASGDLARAVNLPERNELVAREFLRIKEMVLPDFLSNVGVKPYAVLVDFVDNTGKHSLISASRLYGLREKFNPKGGDVLEQSEEIDALEQQSPGLDLHDVVDVDEARRRAEAYKTTLRSLDLLNPTVPNALRNISKFAWIGEGDDSYRLSLMDNTMLTVRQDAIGNYEVSRHNRGVRTYIDTSRTLAGAIKLAEAEVPTGDRRLLSADAGWRAEEPTDKQCKKLIAVDGHWNKTFRGSWERLYEYAKGRYKVGDILWTRGGVATMLDKIEFARK